MDIRMSYRLWYFPLCSFLPQFSHFVFQDVFRCSLPSLPALVHALVNLCDNSISMKYVTLLAHSVHAVRAPFSVQPTGVALQVSMEM